MLTWCACLASHQHCVEVALEGKQVYLRQLQLKYPSSKSKSNSAIILRLGLGLGLSPGGTWAESVDGQLVQLHWKSTLSRPRPPRLSPWWTWPWAESAKSTSPTVGLVQKFVHVLESERVKNWSWSIIKQKQSRSFWSLSFWLSWTLIA